MSRKKRQNKTKKVSTVDNNTKTEQPDFEHKIISDRDSYIKLFKSDKIEDVFKQILDIRKFEIELYWKRTSFFWTLIGSIIAGYFLTFSKADNSLNSLKILFSLSNLGLIFSIGWYFVNRGSKFWQVNWEKHMDSIEDEIIGPLYKTTINKEYYRKQFFKLVSPFPFSVSKINQVLNLVLIAFWTIIITDLTITHLTFNFCSLKNYYSFFTLTGIATAFAIFSLFAFTQTEINFFFKKDKQSKKTKINFEKRGLE